jgi:hypothetical protein
MEISETDVQSAAEIKETLPAMAADNPEQIRRERKTPATVGKKLFRQTLGKGLPKRWKGGGDYFFEQQEDGSLKITGGDKARNLTGGKSVVITDSEKLKEIYEKAHGGDVLEADVTYKVEEKVEEPNTAQMLQADAQRRANVAGPEATKQMEEYKEKVSLGESELTEDEGSRTGESSELLLNFGFSEEEIAGMDPRLKERFEENVLKFNEKIGA